MKVIPPEQEAEGKSKESSGYEKLTAEDRQRIYEEEKARLEAKKVLKREAVKKMDEQFAKDWKLIKFCFKWLFIAWAIAILIGLITYDPNKKSAREIHEEAVKLGIHIDRE